MGYSLLVLNLFWFISLGIKDVSSGKNAMDDYCETETFRAHCMNSEVVIMEQAIYGRMELGSCLVSDLGFMGCYRDIISYMDSLCSGRQACDVPVRELLVLTNPCTVDVRSFLQASYDCVSVAHPLVYPCCLFPEDHALVMATRGFLAYSVTLDTGCGTTNCPWLLQALKGQHINVSIYDFDIYDWNEENMDVPQSSDSCVVYATIIELATGVTVIVCRGGKRNRHLYTSTTDTLEIHFEQLQGAEVDTAYFLLEYEALGCADPTLPPEALITREGDRATISCLGSQDTAWEITCRQGQWLGSYGNCSTGSDKDDTEKDAKNKKTIGSHMAIFIIILVAVMVAIAIVVTGVMCALRVWRSPKGRWPSGNRTQGNDGPMKDCDEIQTPKKGSKKSVKKKREQRYISDWGNRKVPYISAPIPLSSSFEHTRPMFPAEDSCMATENTDIQFVDLDPSLLHVTCEVHGDTCRKYNTDVL